MEIAGKPIPIGLIVSGGLTLLGSLLIYYFNQVKTIDARLDELEIEARMILSPDGSISASKEALEAYFGVQELRRRIERLEAVHAKGH